MAQQEFSFQCFYLSLCNERTITIKPMTKMNKILDKNKKGVFSPLKKHAASDVSVYEAALRAKLRCKGFLGNAKNTCHYIKCSFTPCFLTHLGHRYTHIHTHLHTNKHSHSCTYIHTHKLLHTL